MGKDLIVDINLTTDKAVFEYMTLSAISTYMNGIRQAVAQTAEKEIHERAAAWIKLTSTYNSLCMGFLKGEFGLPPSGGSSRDIIDAIVDELAKQVVVEVYPFYVSGRKIIGGFIVYIYEADFLKILSMSEGHTITEKNADLHWLDWLMIQGNKIIIGQGGVYSQAEWHSEPSTEGRSGKAEMVRGGFFKVPAQFAGTKGSNWITKAVTDFQTLIEMELADIFERAFNANF
jgi:hypothetical protein